MVQFMPFCMQAYGEVATLCARNERRICYATPKSFLEFLKLFKHLLGTTTTKLRANENRLATGVQRLRKVCGLLNRPVWLSCFGQRQGYFEGF